MKNIRKGRKKKKKKRKKEEHYRKGVKERYPPMKMEKMIKRKKIER